MKTADRGSNFYRKGDVSVFLKILYVGIICVVVFLGSPVSGNASHQDQDRFLFVCQSREKDRYYLDKESVKVTSHKGKQCVTAWVKIACNVVPYMNEFEQYFQKEFPSEAGLLKLIIENQSALDNYKLQKWARESLSPRIKLFFARQNYPERDLIRYRFNIPDKTCEILSYTTYFFDGESVDRKMSRKKENILPETCLEGVYDEVKRIVNNYQTQ